MYWVVQENIYAEKGLTDLLNVLSRAGIPHSEHKVVPFVGELMPDIEVDGPAICIGTYSLRHIAKKKQWTPGVFDIGHLSYLDHVSEWSDQMLNGGALYIRYKFLPACFPRNTVRFIRPTNDSKAIAGTLYDRDTFMKDYKNVMSLGAGNGSTLDGDTMMMIARPKHIDAEYRVWVVDGVPVTASQYKIGGRVVYNEYVDPSVIEYVKELCSLWTPHRAFVVDIGLVNGEYKVIETNTLNAAGLYHCDVNKLVGAIESMGY